MLRVGQSLYEKLDYPWEIGVMIQPSYLQTISTRHISHSAILAFLLKTFLIFSARILFCRWTKYDSSILCSLVAVVRRQCPSNRTRRRKQSTANMCRNPFILVWSFHIDGHRQEEIFLVDHSWWKTAVTAVPSHAFCDFEWQSKCQWHVRRWSRSSKKTNLHSDPRRPGGNEKMNGEEGTHRSDLSGSVWCALGLSQWQLVVGVSLGLTVQNDAWRWRDATTSSSCCPRVELL